MKTFFTSSLLFVISVSLLSCQENNLPKVYLLKELRLIGVHVDTPEISDPGSAVTVNVTPIVADYYGAGRTVNLTIAGCIDPGVSYGADPTCDNQSDRVVLSADAAIPFAGGSGHFDAPNYVGPVNSAYAVNIPTGTLAFRSAIDQFNGIPYILEFILTTGSTEVRGFKRIIVSTKTANNNPGAPTIEVNGTTPSTLPSGSPKLSVSVVGTIEESFLFKDYLGVQSSIDEQSNLTWFITGGELDYEKVSPGTSVTWKAPSSAPAGQNVVVVAILRDNRGGLSYSVQEF